MGWSLLAAFTLALFAPFLYRLMGRATGWVLALFPFTVVAFFGLHLPISPGARFTTSCSWVPSLGVVVESDEKIGADTGQFPENEKGNYVVTENEAKH